MPVAQLRLEGVEFNFERRVVERGVPDALVDGADAHVGGVALLAAELLLDAVQGSFGIPDHVDRSLSVEWAPCP